MRIAYFEDLPPGGAKAAMLEFISRLSADHHLDHFTIHRSADSLSVKPYVKKTFVYGRDTKTENYPNPLSRLSADFYSLVSERRVERRIAADINRGRYDVCLVTHSRYHDAPYLLRFLTIPSLYYTHGAPRTFYEYRLRVPDHLPFPKYLYEVFIRRLRQNIDRRNALCATAVATTSRFAADTISMWYDLYPFVTSLGVNTAIFKPWKTKKKSQLCLVGNPEPQKGIDQGLEALSRLKNNLSLVVVSPRKFPHNPYIARTEKLKLNVTWLSGLSQPELATVYSSSLATLCLSQREHFGFSALESMACGTPVIALNEGGFRETVIDQRTGLLIDRDPASLSAAVTKLIENPSLAASMGREGVARVKSVYTWDKAVAALTYALKKTATG